MRNQSIAFFVAYWFPLAISAFTSSIHSPLSQRSLRNHRPYSRYALTKEKEQKDTRSVNGKLVNGTPNPASSQESSKGSDLKKIEDVQDSFFQDFNASHYTESVVANLTQMMDEISQRINEGSMELFENLTVVMDSKLAEQLPDSAVSELSDYISGIAKELQRTQQQELQRQLEELERRFVQPLEQIAFSDVPLFDMDTKQPATSEAERDEAERRRIMQQELVLGGKNSTLDKSSRMRTREIVSNFNVAPLYYSAALLYRWARKVSYPSVVLISTFKSLANVVKTKGGPSKTPDGEGSYEEYLKDAEAMQSGWKRIGEIAAKGPIAKKWAILRRSAEVWAYFSSFYLKDRSITRKYQSGKWSEAKFREERSKLGAEITQNLLRLGPTFIKVCFEFHHSLEKN